MYHHHNLIRIDKIKGVLSKATVIFKLKVADSFKVADLLLTHGRSGINPHWQITENSSRNFSEIIIFRVVTKAVLLGNLSIKNHDYLFGFFNSGRHTDRYTGKLIHSIFSLKPYTI